MNTLPRGAAPIGYFVHHQGRGHAVRCAAIVNALPRSRPVVIFCARDDIFPDLPEHAEIRIIPSLFEPTGAERHPTGLRVPDRTPETLHCAPLGWPGIRTAMGRIAAWFEGADPALMVCDVSAEIAQLSRICSVPHVKVLQHGRRTDAGHRAAYDGAVGLLAPYDRSLAQPDWSDDMRSRTCFAPGLGLSDAGIPADRDAARRRLGIAADRTMVLVMSGAGGEGLSSAPLAVGARAAPDTQWVTVGRVARTWHAGEPANLRHDGWVADAADHLAAADLVVSSAGNTVVQEILGAGLPWIVVPEWRYFDEQAEKARALHRAGAAVCRADYPSSAAAWTEALEEARATHDPALQTGMVRADAAGTAAAWIEDLIGQLRPDIVTDTGIGRAAE